MSERSHFPVTPRVGGRSPDSLFLVNTGDGKGKSTAALGVVLRALAQGWKVCVVQFLKSEGWRTGEEVICGNLGVTWIKGGDGFTWDSPDIDGSRGRAVATWARAGEALHSGEYQLVVLDEITYPMTFGWIEVEEVVLAIESRPRGVHVIATGRGAPPGLLEIADTVTEMVNVRHPFDQGVRARVGIDF